ncbi:MAG: inverse autotransporter beta domain-containing protein, partial [Candidatus Saccharimonas sp.]|nr:inverse autotransporter beta domain-containing protein [Planctomycetaceae bacterium]
MTLRSAGLMALLVLGTSASGQVNTTAPVAADSGVATVDQESFSGGVSLNGTYFDVRHQTNSGVGYRNGFTQFGAFSPIWGSEDWFVAPNLRMTLTDDMATGFNAGVVARRYSAERDRILGVNAYYDNDQSSNNNRYHQFGFGVESLGRIIDVRANGYVP